jgi:hypothetical protein
LFLFLVKPDIEFCERLTQDGRVQACRERLEEKNEKPVFEASKIIVTKSDQKPKYNFFELETRRNVKIKPD